MRQLSARFLLVLVCALAGYTSPSFAQRACDDNVCYGSLAEAESAMRRGHVAGKFFQRSSSHVWESSPGVYRTTIQYVIPRQPPAVMHEPAYFLSGWGVEPTGCAPSASEPQGCASEEVLLAYVQNYTYSTLSQCSFRDSRITGGYATPYSEVYSSYTGSTGNPGVVYFYNRPAIKKWEYELNCPGWGTPEYSPRSWEFQKLVRFTCPVGLYAGDGWSPEYAPSHAGPQSIYVWPLFCWNSDTWRITVDGAHEGVPPVPGLGPCDENCDVTVGQ